MNGSRLISSFFNKIQKIPKNQRSFTLIELLVVVAILALLMSIIIITLNPADMLKKARDVKRISQLQSLHHAIEYSQASRPNASIGDLNTIYISIPDSSSSCANLGLPPLPSGWSYACSTSANYRKTDGTGWVPVNFNSLDIGSPLSVLPIDPTNTTSSGLYYTYVTSGSGWELSSSILESNKYQSETAATDGGDSDNGFEVGSSLTLTPLIFPNNWIKVAGSGTYSTSDFWVMKYEAKYSKAGSGKGDDAGQCYYTLGYDTWDYGKTGTDCPSSWSNTNFVSSPDGSPVAGITHNEAKTACSAIGAHLITNQEWMTIARNAEKQASNWSSGVVGVGCLFRGNVGSPDSCGYNGADPEKGTGRNAKAKLVLSNNQEIWDIAGNVWEHVQKNSSDDLIRYEPSDGGATGWKWIEHTAITDYGDLSYDSVRPSDASWNATYGMGRVFTYNGDTGSASYVLLRGGNWYNGDNAGAFALNLNWRTGAQYNYGGFRCAR